MFGPDRVSAARLFLLLVGVLLPFVLNVELARSRGKNVALMLVLTFFFLWIVTLILVFLPSKAQANE